MSRTTSQAIFALALILLALALIVLNQAGFLRSAESFLLQPISGIQSWLSLRFAALRDLVTSPRDVAALQARIAELEARVAQLEQENIGLREQTVEFRTISALLDYARSRPESHYIASDVIGRDTSPFLQFIWIGSGSDDGIEHGMPVVTDRGLVGRVVEVFASVSRVQLVTDTESAVNVRLQGSRADGVLVAQVNGELWVDLIDQDAEVEVGELVLTSGLGGNYPPDISIGQVVNVRKRDFELFQQAVVQPTVDYNDLEIVLVITDFRPLPFTPSSPTR